MSGWAAAALLLLGVPVVLAYLRRAPLPRRQVPSAMPFRALPSAQPRRRRWPQEWLSLALVLLALGVAAVGLATRPYVDRHVVVVLDDSASMGRGARWDTAQRALSAWLDAAPDAEVTLIGTAPPRVIRFRSADPSAVRDAAAEVRPHGLGGDAAALARAACADDGAALLVLSDALDGAGWGCREQLAPPMGPGGSTAAVTEVAARRVDALGGAELQLGVVSTSGAGRVDVALAVDGVPHATVSVPVREGLGRVVVSPELPRGAVLTARADAGGATLDLPGARRVRAVLVTDAPRGYTAIALGAHPGVDLEVVAPAEGHPGPADLLIVESPPDAPLPAARLAVALGIEPSVVGLPRGRRVRRPLSLLPADDPLWWAVDLEGAFFDQAWALAEAEGAEPLLGSSEGVLAQRLTRGDRDWVVVGLSPAHSDWPLRVGFVHWVANLVDLARPAGDAVVATGVPAAEILAAGRDGGAPVPSAPPGWRQAGFAAGGLLLLEGVLGLRRRRRT